MRAVSNVFNLSFFIWKSSDFFLYVLNIGVGNMSLFVPDNRFFDGYNNVASFYRFKLIERKSLGRYYFFRTLVLFWRRVIFRGRCFRVYCYRELGLVVFNVGFSHLTWLGLGDDWSIHKVKRANFLWFTNDHESFKGLLQFLPNIKKCNKYTLRGVRFKKQIMVRRSGKVGQKLSLYG